MKDDIMYEAIAKLAVAHVAEGLSLDQAVAAATRVEPPGGNMDALLVILEDIIHEVSVGPVQVDGHSSVEITFKDGTKTFTSVLGEDRRK